MTDEAEVCTNHEMTDAMQDGDQEPQDLLAMADEKKDQANALYKKARYADALSLYSEAICTDITCIFCLLIQSTFAVECDAVQQQSRRIDHAVPISRRCVGLSACGAVGSDPGQGTHQSK